jgi:ribonuclease HII
MPPDYVHESAAPQPVCGIDEAGRGPWAGPVVAAAVILDPGRIPAGLDDSKRLTAARRAELYDALWGCARIGVGAASVEEIDQINVLQASFLAMRRALFDLRPSPALALALVDGKLIPPELGCPAQALVGGDGRSLSIAAASIVAKVTRDRMMVALSQQFPGYGWETNMGYGVPAHADGLARLGVTPHHRRSFVPVHKILWEGAALSL